MALARNYNLKPRDDDTSTLCGGRDDGDDHDAGRDVGARSQRKHTHRQTHTLTGTR